MKDVKALADEYLADMKELQGSGDTEVAHAEADDLLMKFLNELGFTELVDAYAAIDKWYA